MYRVIICILALIGVITQICSAQEVLTNELLDELDTLIQQSEPEKEPEDSTVLEQLSSNLDLTLTATYANYLVSTTHYDDDTGEVQLKYDTWAGGDSFSFHVTGWAEYGTQSDTYLGVTPIIPDKRRERRILEVSQLYSLVNLKGADITVGKKVLPNNTNAIAPISQVYHPLDLNIPVDYRVFGPWQVSIDSSLGDRTEFRASIFPAFQDHKVPSPTSRWMNTQLLSYSEPSGGGDLSDIFDFEGMDEITSFILYYFGDLLESNKYLMDLLTGSDTTVVTQNDRPETEWDEMGYSGLVKSSLGRLDMFGSVFYGPNPFPLLYVEDRGKEIALIKKNPMVTRCSGGGSFTWQNLELHSEVLYNHSDDGTDDNYISYTGGVTVTDEWSASLLGANSVHWRIDYAGEVILNHQDAQGYYFSSETIRPFTDDLLLLLRMEITTDLNLYYHMDIDFGHNAQYHKVGGNYLLAPGLILDISTEFFDGDATSFIGSWSDNDRISSRLIYRF